MLDRFDEGYDTPLRPIRPVFDSARRRTLVSLTQVLPSEESGAYGSGADVDDAEDTWDLDATPGTGFRGARGTSQAEVLFSRHGAPPEGPTSKRTSRWETLSASKATAKKREKTNNGIRH